MKLKDILDKEKRNNTEELYKLYLFKDGGWWRAYEWSAYLCQIYPNGLNENERLKPTHKITKDNKDYIFVGLQAKSFDKYLKHSIEEENFDVTSDYIEIDIKDIFTNLNFDDYLLLLNGWKMAIQPKEDKSIKRESKVEEILDVTLPCIKSNNITMFSIIQQILGYDLSNSSPNDNTIFVRTLKEQVLGIIGK